jgi:hypothetical protein
MSLPTTESCGPVPPRAIYPDVLTAFAAIQAHAKAHGYAISCQDKRPKRVLFGCDRAGKYNPKGKSLILIYIHKMQKMWSLRLTNSFIFCTLKLIIF